MNDKNNSPFGDDTLDIVGKALGFALAVYDQTTSNGGPLDRINATRATISEMLDDDRFTDEVASVMDGLCAGLTTYMQRCMADKSGIESGDGYLL